MILLCQTFDYTRNHEFSTFPYTTGLDLSAPCSDYMANYVNYKYFKVWFSLSPLQSYSWTTNYQPKDCVVNVPLQSVTSKAL